MQALQQPICGRWCTLVYLQTNLLKYLPGNVWHFFGRVRALEVLGVSRGTAILGVALEPLLMAAAALMIGIAIPTQYWPWQLALLGVVLELLTPRRLNPIVSRLARSKGGGEGREGGEGGCNHSEPRAKATELISPHLLISSSPPLPTPHPPHSLTRYPLRPLIGQLGYVLLRGIGFALVLSAITPLAASAWPSTISAFSLAWLAGLVVPGAPGGVGVFEAIALGLLQDTFTPAVVLSTVVLYRLVNTLAEALGAALANLGRGVFDILR
jgi:hypothetical protein